MKTRALLLATLVVIVIVAVGVSLSACGSSSDTPSTSSDVQMIAPDAFDVADYAGKPLVLNVFGSWCPPCNAEAPDLAKFAADNPDAQVIGIASEDKESDAVAFMQKYGLDFPMVLDDGTVGSDLGITAYPTTIFFDAKGQETDRYVGASTLAQFNAGLAKAQ
jgi:thiol-disulfide isomerase/thioredoxin